MISVLFAVLFAPYIQSTPVVMDCVSNVALKVDAAQTVTVAC